MVVSLETISNKYWSNVLPVFLSIFAVVQKRELQTFRSEMIVCDVATTEAKR